MAYQIVFKENVRKDLKTLDKLQAGRILLAIFEKLTVAPETEKELTGRFNGLRRLRIGDYRVIYQIVDESVVVLKISHRKDAYE